MLSPSTMPQSASSGAFVLRRTNFQTAGCKQLRYSVEPLRVPRHNDQKRVAERVLLQSVKQQLLLAFASASGQQHRSTAKPVPKLRCE